MTDPTYREASRPFSKQPPPQGFSGPKREAGEEEGKGKERDGHRSPETEKRAEANRLQVGYERRREERPPAPPESRKQRSQAEGQKSSTAYLQTWQKVPEQACTYVERLLSGYNEHTTHVFKHILVCGRLPSYEEGWVPVPARLMQRKKPDADLKPLVGAGLLDMKPHDRAAGRCREWRVPDHIQVAYDRITREHLDAKKVNLFDGRPTERTHKSLHYDDNNNRRPELICGALKQLRHGRFNRPAVEAHLASLEAVVRYKRRKELEAALTRGKGSEVYRHARAERKKAQARYTTDLKCFEALCNQRPTEIGNGIYRYRLAYRPQMSGRLTQLGGGAQSCSSRMKVALYTGIEDLHNYDIKSSQVMIAIELLERDGFDASWLKEYAETKRAKYVYAERAGLPVATWKACLYALLMGATLPKGDITKSRGSIRAELEKVAGVSLKEAYEPLRAVLAPLYEVLEAWHEYLLNRWVPENRYYGGGGWYVKNETGVSIKLDKDLSRFPYERAAQLAAFRLQGREAAFIHKLTALSKEYGYVVVSNEHDGLVTIGEIPEEAVDRVRRKLSMSYVRLPEKDFV